MRYLMAAAAAAVLVFLSFQPLYAFSLIWSISGWDAEQLTKAGITIAPWKHDLIGEDPPLNWIEFAFDCSQFPDDHDVLMTLWVRSPLGAVSTLRAQRTLSGAESISLIFAVPEEYLAKSRLSINIPKLYKGPETGFTGYTMPLGRIVELADQKAANKVEPGDG